MTHTLTDTDHDDIVRYYLDNDFSVREISDFFYPHLSYNTIRRILIKNTDARLKLHKRTYNRTGLDDNRVYYMYKRERSLRKVARHFHVGTTTVHAHILKYQKLHPDAEKLLQEK